MCAACVSYTCASHVVCVSFSCALHVLLVSFACASHVFCVCLACDSILHLFHTHLPTRTCACSRSRSCVTHFLLHLLYTKIKLEASETRMDILDSTQSTIDKKVEALVKRIESMEHGDTSGHMLEEKLQIFQKLSSLVL